MIAFEVTVNGQRVCTAGIDEWGVLTAILSWVRRRSEQSEDGSKVEEELTLDVGGLDSTTPEHLKWMVSALQVGDTVSVRVVETEVVDPPKERRPQNRETS